MIVTSFFEEADDTRILSIYPNSRGFGYVIFEGPQKPLDWGTSSIRKLDSSLILRRIIPAIAYYEPEVLITKKYVKNDKRKSKLALKTIKIVKQAGKSRKIQVMTYDRNKVTTVFEQLGAATKHERAELIATYLTVFDYYKPPKRKPWMSEDSRMVIFDSIALALSFYFLETYTSFR